jgi:hypothetical protein
MQIQVDFSEQELERLYLTYKNKPSNYQKIKTKIVGIDTSLAYRKTRKSGFVFFGGVTFIIAISSSFSFMAEHWDSFIALWMIWGIFFTLLLGWLFLLHKTTWNVHDYNQKFFETFENTASKVSSLQQFLQTWES